MRDTFTAVLIVVAVVIAFGIGWWAGTNDDAQWRAMRDTPDDQASCAIGNAIAELKGYPAVDCSTLP